MAIILVTSASGAPGTTATALGLALVWPTSVLLADCDRTPAQSVLAGYLRGTDASGVGLAGLARAHREGRPLTQALGGETIPLALGEVSRRFLPGFASPGAVHLFEPVWAGLGDAFAGLTRSGVDVIVDAGRIGPTGPPAGLLMQADLVVVLTRSHLPALAALRLHLPVVREAMERIRSSSDQVRLAVIGEGNPYSAAEIATQFATPLLGTLPYDTRAAAVLAEGTTEPRRYGDSSYVRALRSMASTIHAGVAAQRRRIDGAA